MSALPIIQNYSCDNFSCDRRLQVLDQLFDGINMIILGRVINALISSRVINRFEFFKFKHIEYIDLCYIFNTI